MELLAPRRAEDRAALAQDRPRRRPASAARTHRRAGPGSRARSRRCPRPEIFRPGPRRGSRRSSPVHLRRSSGSRFACSQPYAGMYARTRVVDSCTAGVRARLQADDSDRTAGGRDHGDHRSPRTRSNAVDRDTAAAARRRVPRLRRRRHRAGRDPARRSRDVLRRRRPQGDGRRDPEPRRARRRWADGAVAHAARQARDRGDLGARGRGWARARAVVRPARRRGRRDPRRVLPAVRRAADRWRHDPPAAPDRPVARARSDPHRARGVGGRGAGVRARQSRRPGGRPRSPPREELAHELAALPQAALRADRTSAYLQHDLELPAALAQELELGSQALAEAVAGATRFSQGAGRHGSRA